MILPSRSWFFNVVVIYIYVLVYFPSFSLKHKLPKGKDLALLFVIDSSEPRNMSSTL